MSVYAPGTRIMGRYEVAGRPMVGGMGIVYICNDVERDRPVALKTFKPEYLSNRAARDRFLREGTHWVDLGAHPHIVRCYEVLHIDPEVFLVLELVVKEQGREDACLRAWLTQGQVLPVEMALLFALQIVRGMEHATDTIPGFVHRDLKPENVLVGVDRLPGWDVNRVRVTDFGLAAVLQEAGSRMQGVEDEASLASPDSQSATHNPLGQTQLTHGIVGTPLYMAPEQWRGEGVGVYTDVYALGCILYEMMTGQQAADGRSLEALQRAHCKGKLRLLPEGLSGGVRALLSGCLETEAEGRYADWDSVEAAIESALEAKIGRGAPVSPGVDVLSREERVATGWSYNAIGGSYLDIGKAETAIGYFERVLGVGRATRERALEGTALGNLGLAYARLGDARRAIGFYEQSLAIAREIGDRRGEANALGYLGLAYVRLVDARRAIGFYEQHLEIAREIGDRRGEGNALCNLGTAYLQLGDARCAIGFYEQSLAIAREIGDRRGEGNALGNLGSAYEKLGDARCAIGYHEQSLTIHREIGDMAGVAVASFNMALLHAQQGETSRAIPLVQEAARIWTQIGHVQFAQRAQQLDQRLEWLLQIEDELKRL